MHFILRISKENHLSVSFSSVQSYSSLFSLTFSRAINFPTLSENALFVVKELITKCLIYYMWLEVAASIELVGSCVE